MHLSHMKGVITKYYHPDPPHMLKLARNALNAYDCFVDGDGNLIQWRHIQALHGDQESEDGQRISTLHSCARKLLTNILIFDFSTISNAF